MPNFPDRLDEDYEVLMDCTFMVAVKFIACTLGSICSGVWWPPLQSHGLYGMCGHSRTSGPSLCQLEVMAASWAVSMEMISCWIN